MPPEDTLSPAARQALLTLARRAIEAAARQAPPPDCRPQDLPELDQHLGAFVTLHLRERLRGCIGSFLPDRPVWETVAEMARSAAMSDPRFAPLSERELPDVRIELSVLSPLERTDDPLSLELGVHGIYIKNGWNSGTFLPQVATEHHMTKEQFLSDCCAHKAGLAPDAWKDPDTDVYLYTAQIFGEEPKT